MVPFYIPDDSNLNATLLLMALKIVGELSAPAREGERREGGEGEQFRREGGRGEGGGWVGGGAAPGDRREGGATPATARVRFSMPRRAHIKVDGVSSNWGKTMFAFFEYMVKRAIFQEILLTRGPVGEAQFFLCSTIYLIYSSLFRKHTRRY
jgi:hypothetical protein